MTYRHNGRIDGRGRSASRAAELLDLFATGGGRSRPGKSRHVSFDRRELNTILNLYGRKVAEGEWRDYAMDFLQGPGAVLDLQARLASGRSIVVEKNPKLRNRQGQYMVTPGRPGAQARPRARARCCGC